MNKYLAALVAAIGLVASAFTPAAAGLVMTETETMVSGHPGGQPGGQPPQPRERTMMIEGNKQKTIMEGGRAIITDLDKGTTTIIDPAQKVYIERPFPPPGMMGQGMGAHGMQAAEFTKTGKTRTVAGYKCEDYKGEGKFAMGEFTVVSCVSTKAPGAAEFSKYQKAMTAKLKDTQLAMPASLPDGIPLTQDTTTKLGGTSMPNLPPKAAEQLKKQFANRPPMVTKVEVTKLEERKIAASEFEVPAGYTKREAPMMMGGHPGGMPPGHPGGPMMGGAGGSPGGAPAAGASPAAKP